MKSQPDPKQEVDAAKHDSDAGGVRHPILPVGSWMWQKARQIVVFVVGVTILLIGVAMIVLPGPATIVIPIGLAILGTEFLWARRLLAYAKQQVANAIQGSSKVDSSKPPNENEPGRPS